MICQRCNAQYPDHSNFCFHCGMAVNPNMPPQPMAPYQQFPGQPMQTGTSGDEKIFRLGLISFCCIAFWFLIHLVNRFLFRDLMYEFRIIFDFIAVATSSAILIFALAWCKDSSKKTLLIVFLVVGILLALADKFTNGYYM